MGEFNVFIMFQTDLSGAMLEQIESRSASDLSRKDQIITKLESVSTAISQSERIVKIYLFESDNCYGSDHLIGQISVC